jgi:hypothetical protein
MGLIGTGTTVAFNDKSIYEPLSVQVGDSQRDMIDLTHMQTAPGPRALVPSRFYNGPEIQIECNYVPGGNIESGDPDVDTVADLEITIPGLDSDSDAELTYRCRYKGMSGPNIPNEEKVTCTLRFQVVADADSN